MLGKTVVITGASSGIGLATALAFAKQNYNLVLAARQLEPLREAAAQSEWAGARHVIAVPTDVRDEAAMYELAERTVREFGRIDVWVNNAGVYIMGEFDNIPSNVFREVIETNLFGVVHGCRAALRYMRRQNSGTIINVASQAARYAYRFASAYSASKFAVRAIGEALRQDLMETGIEVCTVDPASIDTPLFHQAANYTGRKIKPMAPVYTPEMVARAIVDLVADPQPEVMVGGIGYVMTSMNTVAPALTQRILAKKMPKSHLEREPAPSSPGNVLTPVAHDARVRGGWNGSEHRASSAVAVAALAAVAGAVGWRLWRSREDRPREPYGQVA